MESIEIMGVLPSEQSGIPLFSMPVPAGIPGQIEDDVDKIVDLTEFLIEHPASTFFAKVHGNFDNDFGISDGDILIVDSSLQPQDMKFIIATVNSELSVKIFREINGIEYLQSGNMKFLPLKIEPYLEFKILGVVTKVIHSL